MSRAVPRHAAIDVLPAALKHSTFRALAVGLAFVLVSFASTAQTRGREQRVPCSGLAGLTFEGNTTVTSATEVTWARSSRRTT